MLIAFKCMSQFTIGQRNFINSHLFELLKHRLHNIKNRIRIHHQFTKQQRIVSLQQYQQLDKNIWLKGRDKSYLKNFINPSLGKIWICNKEINKNKFIDQKQHIPEGWVRGRIISATKWKCKKRITICNIELKKNKRIENIEQLPEGWLLGKITEKYIEKYNDASNKQIKYYFTNYKSDIENNILPKIKKITQ